MNQLTTIAALPMAAGCQSRMEPEVGKVRERPQINGAELKAAINRIVEMNMGAISTAYKQSVIYGEGWGLGLYAQPDYLAKQEETNLRLRDLVESTRLRLLKGQP